eukprot:TRINITY_DN3335_c0_g1_i1.p1 TRINITY_DN3335_c0_g1~~TRINITY_DN3335_c0_g1_i1.p1  ORF type:complete len:915 (-),score=191.73 TRINITY_DN3335_c0_g1_i1:53-2797(-)
MMEDDAFNVGPSNNYGSVRADDRRRDDKRGDVFEGLLVSSTHGLLSSFLPHEPHEDDHPKLDTFFGVYVPCLMDIFGVILFERLPWVIGQAGLLLGLLMMFLALCIVIPTVLSVSAIATNGNMKGGGGYFMISRSLGPELGGSVGLIFFTAYTIAGGVFTIGFVEGFEEAFDVPDSSNWTLLYGSITLALMVMICLFGAESYAKSEFIIFIVLVISLICGIGSLLFEEPGHTEGYTSWSWDTLNDNLGPDFNDKPDGEEQNFHNTFAIFFPAMTGFMAGANMSGDLASPAKSIPKGTLAAVLSAAGTYTLLMILFAGTVEGYRLQEEYFIWNKVSFNSMIISIGIFAATLSSVLSSIIGCGNIFYALARDELLPLGWFNSGSPRRALLLTWFCMQLTLLINELNTMAELQTMFFFFSYGIVNFACLTLILTGAPNFRPTWPYFNVWTCGFGVAICFGGMFYVDALYAALGLLCALVVFVFILFRQPSTNWGDVSQAIMYHQVRKYLLRLDPRKDHVKFWRPQVLLLVSNHSQEKLLENYATFDFVNNLKKGGLYVIGDVSVGEFRSSHPRIQQLEEGWRHLIDEAKLKAFPSVSVAPSLRLAIQNLISTAGVGMLKPNTVIIPFPSSIRSPPNPDTPKAWFSKFPHDNIENSGEPLSDHQLFLEVISDCLLYKKNVILIRHFELLNKKMIVDEVRKTRITSTLSLFSDPVANFFVSPTAPKTIDLWLLRWAGEDEETQTSTITLLLLLGHILQQTDIWRKHTQLRVLSYVSNASLVASKTTQLRALLRGTRISAEIHVVPLAELDSLPETLTPPSSSPHMSALRTMSSASTSSSHSGDDETNFDNVFRKLNTLFRSQLTRSSIIFLPFPSPPPPEEVDSVSSSLYVRRLSLLTDNLPPTLLLHSVSGSVISTDL